MATQASTNTKKKTAKKAAAKSPAKTKQAPTEKAKRSHNRVQLLLDASAKLFATKGYKETTLRDIGADIGMVPGSVYYHFASKQELLLAVYEQAVSGIQARLEQAIADENDPWQKLEIAIVSHIETILDKNDYARVMIGVTPDKAPEIEAELTSLRDKYEKLFVNIIEELPLKKSVDKRLLRLMIIGAINSTQTWFHEGAYKPAEIAKAYFTYLKEPLAR